MFIPSIARRTFELPDTARLFTQSCNSIFTQIACCIVLCCTIGCPQPGSTPSSSTSGSKPSSLGDAAGKGKTTTATRKGQNDFPPLKIGLIDCESLETDLVNRWQSVSDQPLEIIKLDRRSMFESPAGAIDVLVYPGNLIGALSQAEWIAPVPQPLLQRTNQRVNRTHVQMRRGLVHQQ